MEITQDVRDYAARKGLQDEAALAAGMKDKAAEFLASGAELYQGDLPAGARRKH